MTSYGVPRCACHSEAGSAYSTEVTTKKSWSCGCTLSISAALTIAGAFVLRRKHPDAPRPYKTFGWPVTPILFIAVSAWMAFFLIRQRPTESLAGIGTLAAGTVLFFVWKRFAAPSA